MELKNDVAIRGSLHSVDQYLNIKLVDIRVVDEEKYPHLMSVKNCFIRGCAHSESAESGVGGTISQIITRTSALTCLLTRAHALTPFQIGGEVHPLVEGARQHRTAAGRHTSGGAGSEEELGHYILNAHGVNTMNQTNEVHVDELGLYTALL